METERRINDCVADAIRYVLGDMYVDMYYKSRNQVCPARGRGTGADLNVFFANQVFKQHVRSIIESGQPPDAPLHMTVISPFGVEYERNFKTSREIAGAIVNQLAQDSCLQALIADIRHNDRGMIKITTKSHLEWHTIMGRLPCNHCGLYFNGSKGLRVHMEIQHALDYIEAQHDVTATKQQLIVYTSSATTLTQWKNTAESMKRLKHALEPGLDAARRGDLDALQARVSNGWDPKVAKDLHGNNALLWAAIEGHLDTCKYLYETCNLRPEVLQGKLNRNVLHWAARNGHLELCKWLIEGIAMNVDYPTDDGTTPLHYAVYGQHFDLVQYLVNECQANIHQLNTFGCNASQWCAMTGNVPILEFLVEKGLNCAILNRNGHSALHKAAIKGHIDICMWLLNPIDQGGGGLQRCHMQKDDEGFTPITFASANHHMKLSMMLQDRFDALPPHEVGT